MNRMASEAGGGQLQTVFALWVWFCSEDELASSTYVIFLFDCLGIDSVITAVGQNFCFTMWSVILMVEIISVSGCNKCQPEPDNAVSSRAALCKLI